MNNGRKRWLVGVVVAVALWPTGLQAAEHGGSTMKEHGGATVKEQGAQSVSTESSGQAAQSTSASANTNASAGTDASVSDEASIGVTAGETSMPVAPSGVTVGASGNAAAQATPADQATVGGAASSNAPAKAEPAPEQIRQAIRDHIAQIKDEEGAFTIEDEQTGKVRTLELAQVHERVGKTGSAFYSCTDMKDTESGEMLDLDFDVEPVGDQLLVTDTRIHKVNGNARYTYDANDNRVPATSTN